MATNVLNINTGSMKANPPKVMNMTVYCNSSITNCFLLSNCLILPVDARSPEDDEAKEDYG